MSVLHHLFYIHGFNGSPKSKKACLVEEYLQNHPLPIKYHVPTLPFSPLNAINTLDVAVADCLAESEESNVGLIGSSMGGFYGTWIAEKYGLPLVLVNPAVRPHRLLKNYLGENINDDTGEKYTFTESNIEELKQLDIALLTQPERYLLLTQQADEVLNYRDGVDKYDQSRQIIQPGGSHGFDKFECLMPEIMAFLFE